MTWTKLSDDFADDAWTLSDAAFRLHVEGLLWSNRKLLDLVVPKDDVRRFARHPEAAAELVRMAFWREEDDGWVIIHHGAYQPTREAVVRRQEANSKNGRRGGRPKSLETESLSHSKSESLSESLSESITHRDGTGSTYETPISPTQIQDSRPFESKASKADYTTEFEEFWSVYPRREAKADAAKAYRVERRRVDAETIQRGVQAYALATLGGDRKFIKLAGGWLRDRRYEDTSPTPLAEASAELRETPLERAASTMALANQFCHQHPDYPLDFHTGKCASCERSQGAIAS